VPRKSNENKVILWHVKYPRYRVFGIAGSYSVSACGEFLGCLLYEAGIEHEICSEMSRFE